MNTRISKMLVCGCDNVAGLSVDGKVLCHGSFSSSDEYGRCSSVQDKTGDRLITQVFLGGTSSVAMDAYGNVKAAGEDDYGQVSPVAKWKGPFKDIVCQMRHTVGLREDGTVVACGWDEFNQCKVSGWHDIVAICSGLFHTVGLKKDGTVIGCGGTDEGQINFFPEKWKDIVSICCGIDHTVGLKKDGTVVACGSSEDGATEVDGWENIIKVICSDHHTVGLKSDGTVVACGNKKYGEPGVPGICGVDDWSDVKDIYCCDTYTLGLKNDGTVLYAGENIHETAAVTKWQDIVHITGNQMGIFGLKKDGRVVTCGSGEYYSYEPVNKWKLFQNFDTIDEDSTANLNKRMEAKASKPAKANTDAKPQAEKAVIKVTRYFAYKGFVRELVWAVVLAVLLLATVVMLTLTDVQEPAVTVPAETEPQQTTEVVESYPTAYVTASSGLNLRAGPGQDYDKITTLACDTCVTVLETSGEWALVRCDEYEGWCWEGYLRYAE